MAKFVTQSGRDMLFTKQYLESLRKTGKKVRISEQFPPEIRERRSTQIDRLKDLREQFKNTKTKVTLVKDKIAVNKTFLSEHESPFERNPLPRSAPVSIHCNKLKHFTPLVENGSTFIAHRLEVTTIGQATAARNAIFQNPDLAKASHIIYAYKLNTSLGQIESGFSDDGENNAGKLLFDLLEEYNLTNTFICVTRAKLGPNIGSKRFELITQAAKELLTAEPTFEDPNGKFSFLSF